MPRAHYVDTLLGTSGTGVVSVLGGATIHVYDQGTTDLVSQTLYTSDAGSGTLTNPFTSEADGTVELWLATAARVDLVATKTGYATIRRTVDVEAVPGSGGGGGAGTVGTAQVYTHTCDGIEDHLALPLPAAANTQRTLLVQMLDPVTASVSLIIGKNDGNSPNVRSSIDPGTAQNVVVEILFAGSDHPSAYYHLVSDHGGGDPAGFNGGMGWWGSGGTPNGKVPEWTLWCALNPDASGPTPFPAGSLVEVWDRDAS